MGRAAAVGIVAGIALGVAATGSRHGDRAPDDRGHPALDSFPGWSGGSAQLEEDGGGVRSLVVDLDAEVPATDGASSG